MLKKCKKCLIEKEIDSFYVSAKYGACKDCTKSKTKKYRENNKDKYSEYFKEYQVKNKEKLKEYKRLNYIENKEKIKDRSKIHYLNNKEYHIKNASERQKNNREKRNFYMREYNLNRRKDPLYRLINSLRYTIWSSIRRCGYEKSSRTYEILGCSYSDFTTYLESKFEIWMNWGNYGKYNGELNYGWDIDHIIPINPKNKKTVQEIINLNHYTNLQPLCSKINRDIKKDKSDYYDI